MSQARNPQLNTFFKWKKSISFFFSFFLTFDERRITKEPGGLLFSNCSASKRDAFGCQNDLPTPTKRELKSISFAFVSNSNRHVSSLTLRLHQRVHACAIHYKKKIAKNHIIWSITKTLQKKKKKQKARKSNLEDDVKNNEKRNSQKRQSRRLQCLFVVPHQCSQVTPLLTVVVQILHRCLQTALQRIAIMSKQPHLRKVNRNEPNQS